MPLKNYEIHKKPIDKKVNEQIEIFS